MREAMIVLAVSSTCLFTSPAHSQERPSPNPEASVETPAQAPQAQPATTSKIKSQLQRGYRLRAAKRDAEAAAVFNGVLALDPRNHAALVELGYIDAGAKRWAAAVKSLKAASAQDASDARLHMDLGYALQGEKSYDAAAAEFAAVAKESGPFQDQAQKALEAVKGAAAGAASATDAARQRVLADGYAALNRGDRSTARRKFEAAAKADPRNGAALKQLGFINLQDGKKEEAAENFEAARTAEPNDYFIALQLGYTYQSLQKEDAARDAFNAASASSDPKIHDAAVAALNPGLRAGVPPAPTTAL